FRVGPAADAVAVGRRRIRRPGGDRPRVHRNHVLVWSLGAEEGGARMNLVTKGEMSILPLGFIGWLFCVAGATIASLPQWFVVQAPHGEGNAVSAETVRCRRILHRHSGLQPP